MIVLRLYGNPQGYYRHLHVLACLWRDDRDALSNAFSPLGVHSKATAHLHP